MANAPDSFPSRLAVYEALRAKITPGPWTCKVALRPWSEFAHYQIETAYDLPANERHPESPRFIAWLAGGRDIARNVFASLEPHRRERLVDDGVRPDQRVEPDAQFIASAPEMFDTMRAEIERLRGLVGEAAEMMCFMRGFLPGAEWVNEIRWQCQSCRAYARGPADIQHTAECLYRRAGELHERLAATSPTSGESR